MPATLILAIAFFNFIWGAFAKRTTHALGIAVFAYLAADAAYLDNIGSGQAAAIEAAMTYAILGSAMLWLVGAVPRIMHSLK